MIDIGQCLSVRALFSFAGGHGHALPMMPIARALARRGHDILFTCQGGMVDTIRADGFAAADSGGRTLAPADVRRPLSTLDRDAEVRVIRDSFAGSIARERAPRIVHIGQRFAADLIVSDEVDFGAAAAADRLGVPHASVVVLAAGGMITPGLIDEPLQRLRAELGAPRPAMPGRFLTIAPVMPSYRDPASPLPSTSLAIRPDVLEPDRRAPDASASHVEEWLGGRPDRPLVYFTLGTIFQQESGDLFSRILTGLQTLDANIVVTVGPQLDPQELGPHNANVLIERFVPQRAVLPRASVVVSHGGSGTVVSALASGVPLVLLPLGADQPWNADRCEALGVGRALDAMSVSSSAAADAVDGVLRAIDYRAAAQRLRLEAAMLPPADCAADALEQLIR